MARKSDDDDVPDAGQSLHKLERLSRLMRQAGHAKGLNPVQWEALRYLARCNALSHSPGALARYLSSTKGTVSQTVMALEKKGLLRKQVDAKDQRGLLLFLTDQGRALLRDDPMIHLQNDITTLSDKTRKRLDRGLTSLLDQERLRQDEPSFGTCLSCRYFREAASDAPAHCMKVNAIISADESMLICVEHVVRS